MEFSELFKESLDKNDLEQCSTLLYSIENIQLVGDASWDISGLLCGHLSKFDDNDSIEFIKGATMYICQLFGNPKELFLVYLENAESFFSNNVKYFLLVDILQALLLRLSPRFIFYSLELALNQLNKLVSKHSLKFLNEKNEQNENQLMETTNKYVDFLEVFVGKDQEDSTYNLKSLLTNSLINLFNEPFLNIEFSDTKDDTEQKPGKTPSSGDIVKRIFLLLKRFYNDFFKLIQELEFKCLYNDQNETLKLNKLALCSFMTYVFTQDFKLEKPLAPKVYDSFFLLHSFLPIINFMLNQTGNEICVEKALYSINYFARNIEPMTFNGDLLELIAIVQLFQLLFRVTIYSTKEEIRKNSVATLKAFFDKFGRKGRYDFLNYFINDNSKDQTLNNYVTSYLIYLFKEEVNDAFDKNESFYKSNSNANFKRIFRQIVKMKNGIKTDLMQESSKINAILNMLRFMLIKDSSNETSIFNLLKENEYLNELKTAVGFSKQHYEQEKKNLVGFQKNDTSMKFEVSAGDTNEKISEPTTDDKIGSCVNAIQSLDLIESLRCRVVELLENQSAN